jgi:hypothetical protein
MEKNVSDDRLIGNEGKSEGHPHNTIEKARANIPHKYRIL